VGAVGASDRKDSIPRDAARLLRCGISTGLTAQGAARSSMLTVESAESTGSWSLRRQPRKAHQLAPHCGLLGGAGCGLGWRAGEETPRPARLEPLLKWSEFKRLDLPLTTRAMPGRCSRRGRAQVRLNRIRPVIRPPSLHPSPNVAGPDALQPWLAYWCLGRSLGQAFRVA
jgi:hypothetical protein